MDPEVISQADLRARYLSWRGEQPDAWHAARSTLRRDAAVAAVLDLPRRSVLALTMLGVWACAKISTGLVVGVVAVVALVAAGLLALLLVRGPLPGSRPSPGLAVAAVALGSLATALLVGPPDQARALACLVAGLGALLLSPSDEIANLSPLGFLLGVTFLPMRTLAFTAQVPPMEPEAVIDRFEVALH